jgi:hypothetical protein
MLRAVLVFILLLSVSGICVAADNEEKIRDLEKKVEELQKQLDSLKQQGSSQEMEEIRRQLQILAQEIEKMRSGEEETKIEEGRRKSLGLGPSASTVYNKKQGVSFAGYGEALYENFSGEEADQIDFVRAIVYLGYRFNDRFLFNSEIEFEHATTERNGAASVEFGHIDYLWNDHTTLRGGLVLVPMGFLNEFHEPTIFLGAKRTLTETFLIPSTWSEMGAGILGRTHWFDYRAYVINGMNAANFNSEGGLEEGKQLGSEARFKTPSFVGRLDATPSPGITAGGSVYAGNAGVFGAAEEEAFAVTQGGNDLKIRTTIAEGHAEYKNRGLQLRALIAGAWLNHVAELNGALGRSGDESIGNRLNGGYVQAGYNIWKDDPNKSLTPYLRFEKLNTQASVPEGFEKDPASDRTAWTFGIEVHPIFNVVIKTDYQVFKSPGVNQFNLALGYSF